ncbi:MAG: phosphoribosylformylglycinamidine synthase [Candidatus Hydrogenedens sp.]|nr:phosphoribosylformylglycinamidine synthase [Candidatus Hydrogenedens sp.]
MSKTVNALILTGFGINCNDETETAFRRAGADTEQVHLNDLAAAPERLQDFHIFAVPGGFSFGDDVASGRILANRLRYRLGGALLEFVRAGKLAIGICNGFQVLVKMGLLPMTEGEMRQEVTVSHNDSNRYEDRWVRLAVTPGTPCVWLKDIAALDAPVRHGEGKFVPRDAALLEHMKAHGLAALRYVTRDDQPAAGVYPTNPNGAVDDIAGICDPTGRIFGLMPHPEAYVDRTNHPQWTRRDLPEEGEGLRIFRNAVEYAAEHLA